MSGRDYLREYVMCKKQFEESLRQKETQYSSCEDKRKQPELRQQIHDERIRMETSLNNLAKAFTFKGAPSLLPGERPAHSS